MPGTMYTKMTSTGSSLISNPRSISKELEAKICASIAGVIAQHGVAKLTTKLVRQAVEKEVHVSLSNHKDVLKRLMHQEFRKIKAKKAAKRSVPEPWKISARRESMLKALNQIYQLVRESATFPAWGLHAIQSLYDLQAVESGEVLRLATLYVRLMGATWLKEDRHADWTPGSTPTPAQTVAVITSVYLIERLGINHPRRVELQELFDRTPTVYSCKELLGWNPVDGLGSLEAEGRVSVCKHLTNALVLWHYAHELGLSLGFSLSQLLQHLPAVYPYKPPDELSPTDYEDQLHLVSTLVLVLSNHGRLRCDAELLPHEYFFLRHHMIYFISQQNVALLGEALQTLHCFEGSSNLLQVRRAMAFLLVSQHEDGSWRMSATQCDASQRYFATIHALCGLSEPRRVGFAPAFPEVTPLLELHLNANIGVPNEKAGAASTGKASTSNPLEASHSAPVSSSSNNSSGSEVKKSDPQDEIAAATAAAPAQHEDLATRVGFLQGLLEQDGSVKNVSAALATHVLTKLTDMVLTVDILKNTGIGRTINKLRKHATPAVAKAAAQLVAKWKKDLL